MVYNWFLLSDDDDDLNGSEAAQVVLPGCAQTFN